MKLKFVIVFIFLLSGRSFAEYGEWKLLNTTGDIPARRINTTMIYDSIADRLIIHAGNDEWNNSLNDTYLLNLTNLTWYKIDTNLPQPLQVSKLSLVFDAFNYRIISYGGSKFGVPQDNVDVLNLTNYQWITNICDTQGTPKLYKHTAEWYYNKMFVIGGYTGSSYNSNLLIMTNNSWKTQQLNGEKLYVVLHTSILLTNQNKIIIFGGMKNGKESNTLYSLDIDTYTLTRISLAGDYPSCRAGHTAIYDSVHNKMIIDGGYSNIVYKDVYSLDLDTYIWEKIPTSGSAIQPHYYHSAAYDHIRRKMYIFGGYFEGEAVPSNKVYELDLNKTPVITKIEFDKDYGDITFTYDLYDEENDVCSIIIEYRGGSAGGGWKKATISGQTNNIIPGKNKKFVWHSNIDEPSQRNENYQIRIAANDGYELGDYIVTPLFELDNLSALEGSEIFRISDNYIKISERAEMKIQFKLKSDAVVKLVCYNVAGDLIKVFIDNEKIDTTENIINWDLKDEDGNLLQSGLYWIAFFYDNEKITTQFIVIK